MKTQNAGRAFGSVLLPWVARYAERSAPPLKKQAVVLTDEIARRSCSDQAIRGSASQARDSRPADADAERVRSASLRDVAACRAVREAQTLQAACGSADRLGD